MKTLFLVFYGFQEYNGISKKIRYQADALRLCGADVRTCHYEVGWERRMPFPMWQKNCASVHREERAA